MELYAIEKNYVVPYLEAIENATIEERTAAFGAFGDDPLPSIITRVEGSNEALIEISGPLSPAGPSPLARFFGYAGTGYADIIAAAKELENDPIVDTVRLVMNTPGGTVAGMDQARQALKSLASVKKVIAENHGMIASAGYYLATAANEINALSPLAKTGSIGIIVAGFDYTENDARYGIKKIKIVSKNAPNKQPDPTTTHGIAVIQDEIDAMERVFIQKITEGRSKTTEFVVEHFGKGGMLIALDPDSEKPSALNVGMIDNVVTGLGISNAVEVDDDTISGSIDTTKQTTASGGGDENKGTIQMDLNTLKAEHAALYAQVIALGVAEGIASGVTKERERVSAHVVMGNASGDVELAMSNISEGVEHTAATNAAYMAAQMTKNAQTDRAGESEGDLETTAEETEGDHEQALANALAAKVGVTL